MLIKNAKLGWKIKFDDFFNKDNGRDDKKVLNNFLTKLVLPKAASRAANAEPAVGDGV